MIRKMKKEDIGKVYKIENESFCDPWSLNLLEQEFLYNKLTEFYVYEKDLDIAGFIEAGFVMDESELKTIAVSKEFRNKKIATEMMKFYTDYCDNSGIKKISLEANVNNIGAIKLYTNFGFKIVSRRKNYYKITNDDAYIMIREVI